MTIDAFFTALSTGGFDVHLTSDGQRIDVPANLPANLREAIIDNRAEVRFRLAETERAITTDLRRLAMLESVIAEYEQNGLASWYRDGWVMIHSDLLNETVVVIRSDDVTIPPGARMLPVYRFVEVEALDGCSDEAIKRAHSAKRIFRGEVVKDSSDRAQTTASSGEVTT